MASSASAQQKPVMWPIIHRDYVSWVPLPMEKKDSVTVTVSDGKLRNDTVLVRSHTWRTKRKPRGGMIRTARQDESGGVMTVNENYTGTLRHERWEDNNHDGRILIKERHYIKDGNRFVEWTYKNKR